MPEKNKINVTAKLKVKKAKVEDAKKGLTHLAKETRKEKGCISYDIHQSRDDDTIFLVYEMWESQGDIDKHFKTPHFVAWMEKSEDITTGPAELIMWHKLT